MIERYKTTKDIVRVSLTRSHVTIGFKFTVFYLESKQDKTLNIKNEQTYIKHSSDFLGELFICA